MDKVSLFNKLKNQKWQLQHHLNNQLESLDIEAIDENKENSSLGTIQNKTSLINSSMFLDRVPANILVQALKNVNLDSVKDPSKADSEDQDYALDDQYGQICRPEFVYNQQLQTDDPEDEITPIKAGPGEVQNDAHYECSESEDGFSDVGEIDYGDLNGCEPLPETSDEDPDDLHGDPDDLHDTITDDMEKESIVLMKTCTPAMADMFSDQNENTVIELNHSSNMHQEKPITPGISRNRSFQELIEDKMDEEDRTSHNSKSEMVSSTPVKKHPRKFLKRGEGLKRFQCGEYSKCRKGKSLKSKESKVEGVGKEPKGLKESKKYALNAGPKSKIPENVKNDPKVPSAEFVSNTRSILKNKENVTSQNNRYTQKDTARSVSKNTEFQLDAGIEAISKSMMQPVNDISSEPRKVTFGDTKDLIKGISVSESADISFQKMLLDRFKDQEREAEELDMFEALEEAAENTSLSSNCSLVLKHFGAQHRTFPATDISVDDKSKKESYEFDDKGSWSEDSSDENDETVTQDVPSCELSPEPLACPPKRIVSKRKTSDANPSYVEVSKDAPDEPSDESTTHSNPANVTDIVKNKLSELEKEITKYRAENNKLLELRNERESGLKQLRKEIDTFQKEKNEELERIEEYRNEEMKKLKNERKLFDKYQKEIKAMPSKEERDEIKELKDEISKLREDAKSKEAKWNAASHRFRTRAAELEEENAELREEIKLLEKQRLERWRSTEDSSNTAGKQKQLSNHVSTSRNSPLSAAPQNSLDEQSSAGTERKQDPATSSDSSFHLPKHIGLTNNSSCQREIKHSDGKVEVILPDQSRKITFPNGTQKTISKDEKTITVAFFNGDVKKTINDKLVYYYAESETTHTTFPDGLEMLEFPNGQVEKRYKNGKTEVIFPDRTVKVIHSDGTEETTFTDGTVQKVDLSGVRMICFANGQKETHTKEYKRREYPNGTVKTVYGDGKQETKYSNGRIRVKDSDGNLILDTGSSG